MTHDRPRRAGAPLAAIVLVLTGWIALRATFWAPEGRADESHAGPPLLASAGDAEKAASLVAGSATSKRRGEASQSWWLDDGAAGKVQVDGVSYAKLGGAGLGGAPSSASIPIARTTLHSPPSSEHFSAFVIPRDQPPAGLRKVVRTPARSILSVEASGRGKPSAARRLSLDSWIFLREGGRGQVTSGPRPASLGASQVGVVARFAFAPNREAQPQAYLRVSRAIVANGESEAAAGLSVRPLRELPVMAHAELRLMRQNGQFELRPAAFLAGGIDRRALGAGVKARGYAQAGYVGGRFATGFADGQLVAEKRLGGTPAISLHTGAGAWGGAQKGASRLDVGPSVSLDLVVGNAPLRIEASYRVRVAGQAQPDSGLALTLATGF